MATSYNIKETFMEAPGQGMIYAFEKDEKHQAFISCHRNPSPDAAASRY